MAPGSRYSRGSKSRMKAPSQEKKVEVSIAVADIKLESTEIDLEIVK